MTIGRPPVPAPERFWPKVDKSGDCWMWTASCGRTGYGHFLFGGRVVSAHRVSYFLAHGSLPDGLQIDHTCHNRDKTCAGGGDCPHRRCVNPAHLEPVTPRENTRRGRGTNGSHCKHGHEYTLENTRTNADGSRACRACAREYRIRRRNRAAAATI